MRQLKDGNKEEEIKTIYEAYFIFAMMWSYGASLTEDKIQFSGMVRSVSRVKFPEGGQCFDYFYDPMQM